MKFVNINKHAFRKTHVFEIYYFGNRIRVITIHGGTSEIYFNSEADAKQAYDQAMEELNQ